MKYKIYIPIAIFIVLLFGAWYYGSFTQEPEVLLPPTEEELLPVAEAPSAPKSEAPVSEPPAKSQAVPPATAESGRVVFVIADAGASLDTVKSVTISVNQLRAHSAMKGWFDIPLSATSFDLLELKKSGNLALLSDRFLEKGDYTQIRLNIEKATVVLNDGTSYDAKLPSGELKIVSRFTAKRGEAATVVFDFQLDRSLHTTGDGKYIFAPVVTVLSRGSATVVVGAGNRVSISSGGAATQVNVGMNESGETKENFALDPRARLDLLGSVIKVIPQNESEEGVKFGASQAIDIATQSGKITTALSIKITMLSGTKIWQVVGLTGTTLVLVNVHAGTGAILE